MMKLSVDIRLLFPNDLLLIHILVLYCLRQFVMDGDHIGFPREIAMSDGLSQGSGFIE